jgi:hypothetical protein
MRAVALKLCRVCLAFLVLYAGLVAVSVVLSPFPSASEPIDTSKSSSSPYLTEPKYVFFARERAQGSEPKLLLIGASNTQAGLKRAEVAARLPELDVHNLAVGGSNVTQLSQIVDLVRERQSSLVRRQSHYVVGLWYGLFATDAARWEVPGRHPGDTDIDIERYRYGFYRRTANGPAPLVPASAWSAAAALANPLLLTERVARDVTVSLREQLSGKAPRLTDEQRNARWVTPSEQQKYLEFWRKYMGPSERLSVEQFERLRDLALEISNDGGTLLLVDLPIPPWHEQGSDFARQYQQQLRGVLPELTALPGVKFVSLRGGDSDDDFSDEVHPKPRVSPGWAARLADAVRESQVPISAADAGAKNDHG